MKIRVGVIGAGWVARARHLPRFRAERGAETVAVFDRNADRARETAGSFGVPVGTDDLEEFFAARPDVVSVCTPPSSHAALAIDALSRGCHVLTEKPMAMNSAEAEAMASAARSADRLLCVAHNFLFSRSVGRAAPLLRDRAALQYVMGVQLSSHHRRLPSWHPDLPGGLLFDEIPHLLYLLQHWLGPLSLEDAGAVHRSPVGGPVVTEIRLRGPHGPGLVTVISGAPVSEWHVTVVSDLGVVDLDLFRDVAVRVGPDGSHKARDVLRTSARASFEHWRGFAASGTRMTAGRLFWGHDVLISRFLGAVAGSNALPVALDDALRVVAVTDDILAALDAG